MNRACFQSAFICVICGSLSSLSAAPPAVSYLYPAGAQRGTSTEITATGTLDPWPAKVWVSGKGVSVVAAKDKGKLSVSVEKDAIPGVYWLRAFNDDGVSTLRPFIVGTLPEASEKEPNDETAKPQSIAGNVVVNGKLEKAGDVDCFSVTLKKGQTLVASLEANHTLKSPMDTILQIVSPDGFVLDENHDYHGLDPQLAFTAPKDGTFVVRVFAFPSQPDTSIRFFGSDACIYRLTLTTGGFASHAMPLAVSDLAKAATVQVEGWNIPKRFIFGRVGLEPNDTHATLECPDLANAVRVRVEPHPTFDKMPAKLTPPFSLSSRIEKPGGEVLIPFEAKKGQALTVEVESHEFGLALNPVIRVLDAEKKQLVRAEPAKISGDTVATFALPADGTYTIAVSDLYKDGGPRFAFLLRVSPPVPDYDLSVTADRFTVAPEKPVSIPVKVTRKGGFAKPVDVVAEGLPEGVKFEITQPAKPDPNTVTIALSAEKPVSGAFRLVGKVKDEPKLTRVAVAPLAEFETTTPELFITPGGTPPPPKKKK